MMRLAGKKRADGAIGRRELVRCLAAGTVSLLTACGPSNVTVAANRAGPVTPPRGPAGEPFGGPVEVHSWFDLPDEPRSRELSGIAWDEARATLWGVQDESGNIVPLVPDRDLQSWRIGPVIALRTSFPLDLEGIVVVPDGFIVASEKGPRVFEVDREGKLRRDIPLPAHYSKARHNKSLESLSLSPDGHYLFTTTEEALTCDGPKASPATGTRVRILRMTRDGGEATEHAYITDPLPHASGDYGVSDLAALSNEDVLVLERGWNRGWGNTVRIYRASLAGPAASCLGAAELAADAPIMAKSLVVDLATLTARDLPATRQKQEAPILDNFEGLAVGPTLPDGRRSLLLVSDDNGRTDQFARIVVLAVG